MKIKSIFKKLKRTSSSKKSSSKAEDDAVTKPFPRVCSTETAAVSLPVEETTSSVNEPTSVESREQSDQATPSSNATITTKVTVFTSNNNSSSEQQSKINALVDHVWKGITEKEAAYSMQKKRSLFEGPEAQFEDTKSWASFGSSNDFREAELKRERQQQQQLLQQGEQPLTKQISNEDREERDSVSYDAEDESSRVVGDIAALQTAINDGALALDQSNSAPIYSSPYDDEDTYDKSVQSQSTAPIGELSWSSSQESFSERSYHPDDVSILSDDDLTLTTSYTHETKGYRFLPLKQLFREALCYACYPPEEESLVYDA